MLGPPKADSGLIFLVEFYLILCLVAVLCASIGGSFISLFFFSGTLCAEVSKRLGGILSVLIPLVAMVSLYIAKISFSSSSLPESSSSESDYMYTSLQRGFLSSLTFLGGLKRVALGINFFPRFFLLLIILLRFFFTLSMTPSSLLTKAAQSWSLMTPPSSSLLEW